MLYLTYLEELTQAFVSLFASLGLSQLILGLFGALLLLRYRSLVPVFLLVLLFEHLARKGINVFLPIARSGGAGGGALNWAIFAVMLLAFVLSIRQTHASLPPSESLRVFLAAEVLTT